MGPIAEPSCVLLPGAEPALEKTYIDQVVGKSCQSKVKNKLMSSRPDEWGFETNQPHQMILHVHQNIADRN
jgi:hypothetical protein